MTKAKVDVIVDLQFGSTGKGAIAGYLAKKNDYEVVISANMPNAGHTFIDERGNKMVHKVLPSGVCGASTQLVLIAPGAVFSIQRLKDEMDHLRMCGYGGFVVAIHEAAVILDERHKQTEKISGLDVIGSTQQGSAEAMIDKIRRGSHSDSVLAKDHMDELDGFAVVTHKQYLNALVSFGPILVEGAQGYSLGLNAGFWPYCTSRDCTTARVLADTYVPHSWVRNVIGSCRTFPIRVGGTSGPGYEDQEELTWEDIGVEPERTTVTNRIRRVFTFSQMQIREAIMASQPDEIFLNFCNYMGKRNEENTKLDKLIDSIGKRVKYFGWGPTINDIDES
jgi:adenylosuccinate synthase